MAVTVSITTLKIDVTSTGGVEATLEEIYQAVIAIDAARMTRTGAGSEGDPYLYNIPPLAGQTYCEFEISGSCIVLFQNSGSNYSKLSWTWGTTTAAPYILDFAATSDVTIEPGFEFDMDASTATHYGYIYFRGGISAVGTEGNEIIFKHYRNCYIYPYQNDQTWDYVKFQECTHSAAYMMYLTYPQNIDPLTLSMKHITIENASNLWGRVYFQNESVPNGKQIFEDWTIENLAYPFYTVNGNYYLKRFHFKTSTIQGLHYVNGLGTGLPMTLNKTNGHNTRTLQPMCVFEDCTWEDVDGGNLAMYNYYQSRILLINPTFIGMNYGAYTKYGSLTMWKGTITMASGNPKQWGVDCSHTWVRYMNITVQDLDGNPIENAMVSMVQSEGKEWYSALTEADGKIYGVYGNSPILTEKEETSNGVFIQWSDDEGAGQYHTITCSKAGYMTQSANYEMTQDRDITITLTPLNDGGTNIYDSTIYDSVIY